MAIKIRISWDNPQTGRNHNFFGELPVTIGRDEGNDLTLDSDMISRFHARVEAEDELIILKDQSSVNGILVNGRRIHQTILSEKDVIQIGPFIFRWERDSTTHDQAAQVSKRRDAFDAHANSDQRPELSKTNIQPKQEVPTVRFEENDRANLRRMVEAHKATTEMQLSETQTFPPPFFDKEYVKVEAVRNSGLPVEEKLFITVGGGLGSFMWVDNLLIYGASAEQIGAIGLDNTPHKHFARLATNSQIPPHERLRSDSGATPDNIWGFPGYALREIWHDLRQGKLAHAGQIAWQIFAEPLRAETYTPQAGQVYAALEREATRLGWENISRAGRVRAIRKLNDGRYVVAYTQSSATNDEPVGKFMIATYVHVAVGYSGLRLIPALQQYRETYEDLRKVVNAYEHHEHIYEHLAERGGTVLIHGRNVITSRVLQRLSEVHQKNASVRVIHLMRSPRTQGQHYGKTFRKVANHWEYQVFNYPKSATSGAYRALLEQADRKTRHQLYNDWGGSTTAGRRDWQNIVEAGLREGWYDIRFGEVERVQPDPSGKVVTMLNDQTSETDIFTDFVIDATGLHTKLEQNPLLRDLIERYFLDKNGLGNLEVSPDFELVKMRNGKGRMFAAGAITHGGPYAPVDTFSGLQYAAHRSVEQLVKLKVPQLAAMNMVRSLIQWLYWVRGIKP